MNLLSERLAFDGVLHGLRPGLARQLNFVFLQDRLQALAEVPRVLLGFPHLEHLEVGARAEGHVIRKALGRPDPLILQGVDDTVVLCIGAGLWLEKQCDRTFTMVLPRRWQMSSSFTRCISTLFLHPKRKRI